ncbi:MAG: hypothetical protein ACK5LT_04450 [Lachnospirales bacterium]
MNVYPCYLSIEKDIIGKINSSSELIPEMQSVSTIEKIRYSIGDKRNSCHFNNICKGKCYYQQNKGGICVLKTAYKIVLNYNRLNWQKEDVLYE